MPRLAWFTPLPPLRSGIAQYNLELLPALASSNQIDVFVDGPPNQFVRPAADTPIHSAHDFVWKHHRHPYDLIVYQLGNAPCHDYMWAYMVRYPGLVALHDGQLHHARARWLLQQKRDDDYRSEFRFSHPDANVDLAELGIVGLLGSLTYLWPMLRIVVESARSIVVHNHWLAAEIAASAASPEINAAQPNPRIEIVEMGVPAPDLRADASETVRQRHGIPADAVLFIAFGKVTPEKRISEAIWGLASIVEAVPNVHLLLAGEAVDYYDPRAEARRAGVNDHVTIAGFVPDEATGEYLAAADICLCMRWPSSRETSASWLRCLAAGRPTITTDLVHTVDIPALDPRTWTLLYARGERRTASAKATASPPKLTQRRKPRPTGDESAGRAVEPVCVSIDILDEDHSLKLAMRRLATDARLRAALGDSARKLWMERFRLDRMVAGYRDAIEMVCTGLLPDSRVRARLPAHLVTDGTEHAARLLRQVGLPKRRIAEIWTRWADEVGEGGGI